MHDASLGMPSRPASSGKGLGRVYGGVPSLGLGTTIKKNGYASMVYTTTRLVASEW